MVSAAAAAEKNLFPRVQRPEPMYACTMHSIISYLHSRIEDKHDEPAGLRFRSRPDDDTPNDLKPSLGAFSRTITSMSCDDACTEQQQRTKPPHSTSIDNPTLPPANSGPTRNF